MLRAYLVVWMSGVVDRLGAGVLKRRRCLLMVFGDTFMALAASGDGSPFVIGGMSCFLNGECGGILCIMSHVLCPIVFMMLECDRVGADGDVTDRADNSETCGGMFSYFACTTWGRYMYMAGHGYVCTTCTFMYMGVNVHVHNMLHHNIATDFPSSFHCYNIPYHAHRHLGFVRYT